MPLVGKLMVSLFNVQITQKYQSISIVKHNQWMGSNCILLCFILDWWWLCPTGCGKFVPLLCPTLGKIPFKRFCAWKHLKAQPVTLPQLRIQGPLYPHPVSFYSSSDNRRLTLVPSSYFMDSMTNTEDNLKARISSASHLCTVGLPALPCPPAGDGERVASSK